MKITLRPALPGDESFLFELYASTRAEEMALWGWDPAQQEMFLKMQFKAQQRHYEALLDKTSHDIILLDQKDAGHLIVIRTADEIRLADIALLPAFRGCGIGGRLIEDLIAEAEAARKPVRLHVEKNNRAITLYRRLGFSIIEDLGMHYFMERARDDREGGDDA